MNRCKLCLISDTRPDTAFVDGVCSACITHANQLTIDWQARKRQLINLISSRSARSRTGYDCIVASSGGKDSFAQVLDIVGLGFRPLCVTATTCMLTPMGRCNLDVLRRIAPSIEVTPDQEVRAKLNRLGLELVGDVSWPEHAAIFTTPMRVAVMMGIPLVFYGENPQAQYGGPVGSEAALQMTQRWVSEFGGFLGLRPSDFVGQRGITEADMEPYSMPYPDETSRHGIEAHFLGQYLGPWDSHANAKRARIAGMVQRLPSEANWWPFENLDNAMTGLHDYMMFKKYGFGRACQQLSVDIRHGRIARDVAEFELGKRDGMFPNVYAGVPFDDVLERLCLRFSEFEDIVRRFTGSEVYANRGVV